MAILLKTASVWVSFIQIMQVRVQNKGKSIWKSRYDGDVSHTIELQVQQLATKLNVNKNHMIFNVGDLVWLHLRKERFPNERKSKLLP